jgi:hypothetical protein
LAKQLELFTSDEEVDTVTKFEDKYQISFKSGTTIRISKLDFNKMMGSYFSETITSIKSNTTRAGLDADTVSTVGVWGGSQDGNNYRQMYHPPPQYNPQDVAFPSGSRTRYVPWTRESDEAQQGAGERARREIMESAETLQRVVHFDNPVSGDVTMEIVSSRETP